MNMEQTSFQVYPYRWVVLALFMAVIVVNQLMWITFAPITGMAMEYYHVSDLSIGLLSMIFMIVYIFVSIPASWIIDTFGLRISVGIGAVLTGVFGLLRGLEGDNFTWVFIAQLGIAIGQPFLLNAMTTVAARWFPIHERAVASGFGSLAMYLGIVIGMLVTPFVAVHSGIPHMLVVYGVVSSIVAVIFLLFAKDHPPTPACPPELDERSLVFVGMKNMLRKKEYLLLLLIFFFGLGVFNAVATWIEQVVSPRGFSVTQAGTVGGLMIVGGLVGAVVMSWLSDRYKRRVPFILIALFAATVGLIGVSFATNYFVLLASSFVLGFFLLSAGPIGFQYGAEIAHPAPEGTSNGLLLMMGQISGILFIVGMDLFKDPVTHSMNSSLIILIGLMVVSFLMGLRLKESKMVKG